MTLFLVLTIWRPNVSASLNFSSAYFFVLSPYITFEEVVDDGLEDMMSVAEAVFLDAAWIIDLKRKGK